ncbi:MAG: hypothetical protein QM706_14725 [Nitrospira sp.]
MCAVVDRRNRRTVSQDVGIAMREHDDVSGRQGNGTAVSFHAGIGLPFGDEMKNDDMLRMGREIGGHRAGVGFPRTPGSRKFTVEKDGAIESDGPEKLQTTHP